MAKKIKDGADNTLYKVWGQYSKGILIPIIILICIICVGFIDAGAEAGNYPVKKNAVIKTVVILEDGNEYIVSEKDTNVTVNTYNSVNPQDWEISKY